MGFHIEQLLQLTADYHNFCNDKSSQKNVDDTNELNEEMLDLIAAAAYAPVHEDREHVKGKKPIC